MKMYDLSLSLSANAVRWGTAQPVELVERKRMSRGDTDNSSSMHTSVRAGTHVDAPLHFVPGGATIESLPLDIFMGPARLCAVEIAGQITGGVIAGSMLAAQRLVVTSSRTSSLLWVL